MLIRTIHGTCYEVKANTDVIFSRNMLMFMDASTDKLLTLTFTEVDRIY